MTSAAAPAKLILCGEHAVVYRRPAIALPLPSVQASATLRPAALGSGLRFVAPDLQREWQAAAEPHDPLSNLAAATLAHLAVPQLDAEIAISSQIPIASGMGSGAAIATAVVRVIAAHLGRELDAATVSQLVYESERHFHGTPSGIDNTVVAYAQPIWFQRQSAGPPLIAPLQINGALYLLVGDTGVRSATHLPVSAVRERHAAEPERYAAYFDQIGELVIAARDALASGDHAALGAILNANHELLGQIGVSSPELDRLVAAAQQAGALGAKLSGAGWGGVMLALVDAECAAAVANALRAAGAVRC